MPRWFNYKVIDDMTTKYTISFSNTAGPIKEFQYKCPVTGKEATNISSQSYVNTSGNIGFNITAVS